MSDRKEHASGRAEKARDGQQPAPELSRPTCKLYRRITIALQVTMLLGLAAAVYELQWFTVFLIACILLLTTIPAFLGRRFEVHIPAEFEVLVVLFIFASLFLGEMRGYFVRFWWWDIVLHTGSGFLLGITGFLLVYLLNRQEKIELHMKPIFVAIFSFTFAMAVGALWEIFEFGMDTFLGLNMQKSGLVDTMGDLAVDAMAALVIASLGYIYMRSGTEYFVERWITSFVEANPRLFQGE